MVKKIVSFFIFSIFCFSLNANEIVENYNEAIETENKNVVLIFTADWCGACKNLKNNLNNLDFLNYTICFVNVDENKNLKNKYNVKSLPTSIILFNKKIVDKKIGFEKESYNLWLKQNKKNNSNNSNKNDNISIRVLILKHSKEQMADDDANMIINAIEKSSNNLKVQSIGNHFINETKKIRFSIYECSEINNLKDFIDEKIKINYCPNDTVILFTIGHGSPNGHLHNLGQRSELQKCIAEAAEINNQKILWWQLSCYAAANLPSLDSLNFQQKKLLSILNTSNETTLSPAYLEGKIIEKLFTAMIVEDPSLDEDKNNEITSLELKNFLNITKKGRGDLLRTFNFNESIFGTNVSRKIKIINHNNNSKVIIPIPKK